MEGNGIYSCATPWCEMYLSMIECWQCEVKWQKKKKIKKKRQMEKKTKKTEVVDQEAAKSAAAEEDTPAPAV